MRRRWLSLRADFWTLLALVGDFLRDFADWTDRRSREALNDWFDSLEDE